MHWGNAETRNIPCSAVHSGRFLSIYLNHNGSLALCEVQVFGCKFLPWSFSFNKVKHAFICFHFRCVCCFLGFVESKLNLTFNIQIVNFTDPDNFSRVFQEEDVNIKISGSILRKLFVESKTRCAVYCLRDNTCTQFSYHSDAVGNNCLLGSAREGAGRARFFLSPLYYTV